MASNDKVDPSPLFEHLGRIPVSEMARRMGINRRVVREWRTNYRAPSREKPSELARNPGLDPEALWPTKPPLGMVPVEITRHWRDHAKCAGKDVSFFPEGITGGGCTTGIFDEINRAKAWCALCPVADQCLEYALVNNIDHGVWAGTTPEQRRSIRKQRRLGAAS